ncbi:MAG: M56 family metallopeptidase, partial [Pseudomonadota bacterium]
MMGFDIVLANPWACCFAQTTVLLLIGVLANHFALKRTPAIAASVGVILMVSCVCIVLMTLGGVPRPIQFSSWHAQLDGTAEQISSTANGFESTESLGLPVVFSGFAQPNSLNTRQMVTPAAPLELPDISFCLSVLLLTTLFVSLVRFLWGVAKVIQIAKSSELEDSSSIGSLLDSIAATAKMSVRQSVHVRTFAGRGSPFISWATGNTVFVPQLFKEWTREEQAVSLQHELAHLERGDKWCRLLIDLSRWILWLHPLAWLLGRQTELAQDLAADQLAANSHRNNTSYCQALSRLALRFDAECRHCPSLGVSVSSSLIRRITMLKDKSFYRRPSTNMCRAVSLVVAVVCLVGGWSVVAQTKESAAQKKGTDVILASHHKPLQPFAQPITKPWGEFGVQSGYFTANMDRLLQHPHVRQLAEAATEYFESELL